MLLKDLEEKLVASESFPIFLPVYSKWLDTALAYFGFKIGQSFHGQEIWNSWIVRARVGKQDLLKRLTKQAMSDSLSVLLQSVESDRDK